MLFDLDPGDPRPVFRQIADEVRRSIAVGVLKPGDPLPAVRKLAADLKVNPNTVQHAYRTLEQEGAVHVRRGLGTFVSAATKAPGRAQQAALARRIAEKMLREAFRHGLLASDLIEALTELSPKGGKLRADS
jgi:GntR family transcriptional regulator